MAPCKRQVKARRHLACDHFHSFVDFALSGCITSWAETMEDDFTFQCKGCYKVECLTAGLARFIGSVKGMEVRMIKETDGTESDDRERGRNQQCSDKKDEERRLRGGRASASKNRWRKNNRKHDMQEGDRGESDSREGGGGGQWDKRGEKLM